MPTSHHRRQQAIRSHSYPLVGTPRIILPDVNEEDGGLGYHEAISHTMPYAEPNSPIPSPAKETSSRKGWMSPPTHIEDMEVGPSKATGPMPGIPRRTSSNHSSSSSTPRRNMSPTVSRHPSGSQSFVVSRPMEGLPRRFSGGSGLSGVSGLPTDGGSLGLKLHPSPVKSTVPPPSRPPLHDPSSSVSTVDSSLPTTPSDEPQDLPYESPKDRYMTSGIPFPPYEPPPRNAAPARSAMSPARPTLMNSRRASQINSHSHRREGHSGSLQMFPHSSSTSHLPAQSIPAGTLSPMPRPASMIRKKSGEVVKPSLKQRSMSTPDLTRQPNDSTPSTPGEEDRDFPEERSKSVRFADADEAADGQALENVVLFLREQKVTAIGKAADPDRAGVVTDTETERDEDQMSDFVQFRTRRNAAAQKTDDDRLVMEGGERVPRIRVDFSPDSKNALKSEQVVMERIELATDAGPLHLKGTAIVRNLSFQKWVAVRFTLDNWQTVSEVAGLHVTHIPHDTTGDEGWDRFSFSVKLEDYKRKLDERQLVMCIRFSIDGHEWWDSNNGLNYNFTFKKAAPRRQTRHSGPAQYKMPTPSLATLPGLRQNRVVSPSSQINRAFGVTEPSRPTPAGPKSWIFPKFAANIEGPPSRPESPPITSAPPASYMAPKVPDVHTHLSLSKYCAPSPPQSPPHSTFLSPGEGGGLPLVFSPDTDPNMSGFVNGHPATLYPGRVPAVHERRSSWNGESGSWSSFSQALVGSDTDSSLSVDGDSTPVALRSRSPQGSKDSRDASPEFRGLRTKRSTGDLRALLSDETPPSSNLSSPPSPAIVGLPMMAMSPDNSSVASTGASSPATVSRDSATELSELVIQVDPEERGRIGEPKMLTNSYQEFLDRFCFFQSPRMTPVEGVVKSNNMRPFGNSGQSSPNGFPFFASSSGNSPRGPPTPVGQYDSASDAFNFAPHHLRQASAATTDSSASERDESTSTTGEDDEGSGSTLSNVSYNSNTTPKATPLLGNSPPLASQQFGEMAGYGSEGLPWARMAHASPASLAAGH